MARYATIAALVPWFYVARHDAAARAALPIELEVAAQADAPFGALQSWHAILAEMDLARLRLRGAHGGDQPRLEVLGSGAAVRYRLLGVITRRDELVLPGGKFSSGDRAKLRAYFAELPQRVQQEQDPPGRFDLTQSQFEQVLADLTRPFAESTLDGAPHELVAAITRDFALPLAGAPAARTALRDAAPFAAQLQGLSSGTVLAAVLRSAGWQFAPQKLGNDPLTLRAAPLDDATESWPVGWKPVASPRQTAPAMYRITNIEIENFTLDKALAALAPHMAVPLVIDSWALTAAQIDPAQAAVRLPRRRTFVRHAMDGILSQSRLAGELRVDENGRPFYWITKFGKNSPRAVEVVRDQPQP